MLLLVSLLTKFKRGDLGEGGIVKFLPYPTLVDKLLRKKKKST